MVRNRRVWMVWIAHLNLMPVFLDISFIRLGFDHVAPAISKWRIHPQTSVLQFQAEVGVDRHYKRI